MVSVVPKICNCGNKFSEKFKVDKIELTGNYKTKDYIILRELIIKEGDIVTPGEIERDRLRILNTRLFERVQVRKKVVNGKNILEFQLTERLYVLPVPVLKINDKDWNKISYGGSLAHNNFRGRAEKINATIWKGYNPGYILSFFNPWIAGNKKILLRANLFNIKKRTKSILFNKYNEYRTGFYFGFGKRFGLYLWTNLSLGYEKISVSRKFKGGVFSKTGSDNFFNSYFEVIFDNRDLRKYPGKGWNNLFWISRTEYFNGNHNFFKFGFSISKFTRIKKGCIFAFNLFSTISSGKLPSYSREYFGYERRIRGHYYSKLEGDNLWGGILELRFPFGKLKYINWQGAPVFKKYFRNLEFGINGEIFADFGSTWSNSDRIFNVPIYKGFGAGINFRLPYDSFLRFDIAVNEKKNIEFLILEGISF